MDKLARLGRIRSPFLVAYAAMFGSAAMALMAAAPAAASVQDAGFPHERHRDLFPACVECHQGVPTNDRETFYPGLERCNPCHSGDRAQADTWSGRDPRGRTLRFEHGVHQQLLGPAAPTCERCHVPADGPDMAVSDEVQLGTCWQCHGRVDTDHMVDAACATCHVPLASTGLGVEQIRQLPVPGDHDAPLWLSSEHGARAGGQASRCATCHTSDRCTTCHVDADREEIAAVPAAPAGMELPRTTARYPVPDSHGDPGWLDLHGSQASRAACATCHTEDDCTACHVAPVPDSVAALPRRAEVTAPGARVARRAPGSHEAKSFIESHGGLAAEEESACATCHEGSFCTQCH